MTPTRPVRAIALTLLSFAAVGCHTHRNNGLTPVTFQADWYPQPEHGGFYDALAKGYYKAEGLDVTIMPGGPYLATEALVASGNIQFAMNSSDHILESIANSNEPIIAIGATMQYDPQGIMVHADSPVHTWTDLNGHSVAVRTGATWWEYLINHFHLDHVGEAPLTYSVANFVHDPGYIQQAFVTSEPYFANKAGVPTRVLLNSDAGYSPYRVFFTSTTYAQQHPDIVAKFTRASIRGWKDYMQDPTVANALIEKLNPAMNKEWATYSYNALKSGHFVTGSDTSGAEIGKFDPARWNTMYQQLLGLHVLNKPIDPSTAYTMQYQK
jgi:NitT/TauT family transport system substrate-binding protein